MTLQLAIVASGGGSNAQAIIDAVDRGALAARIRLIASNRPQAGVLDRARAAGIDHLVIDHTAYPDRAAYDRALVAAIRAAGADTVALAGYMRLLTPDFLQAFPGRVLNIHPALLPAFPGVRGVADAQNWGVKIAGCTVHFVDEHMDHGAIIAQAAVPCLPGEALDDLLARVQRLEHRIYPQALQWLAAGRIRSEDRQIHIDPPQAGHTAELASPSAPSAPSTPSASLKTDGPCLVWPPLEAGF